MWNRVLGHSRSGLPTLNPKEGPMENTTITIGEMDERVRTAISQARQQLRNDRESLASLDEFARLWNDLSYRLIMSYTGISLMKLVTMENGRSILQLAQSLIPQKGRSLLSLECGKSLSEFSN
jgi:hypothetical protein